MLCELPREGRVRENDGVVRFHDAAQKLHTVPVNKSCAAKIEEELPGPKSFVQLIPERFKLPGPGMNEPAFHKQVESISSGLNRKFQQFLSPSALLKAIGIPKGDEGEPEHDVV